MKSPPTRIYEKELFQLLKDREWHDFEEVKLFLRNKIPPEIASRRALVLLQRNVNNTPEAAGLNTLDELVAYGRNAMLREMYARPSNGDRRGVLCKKEGGRTLLKYAKLFCTGCGGRLSVTVQDQMPFVPMCPACREDDPWLEERFKNMMVISDSFDV